MLTPALVAVVVGALIGIVVVVLRRRRARKARPRVVELPNSHYTSPLVRQREQRDRWHGIHLAKLHPLNRSEVERLLGIASSRGVTALSQQERIFLDQLAGGT